MLVWPKNDEIRKMLKHPGNAVVPFREEGPADWPDDTFTYRRVQEGDLLLKDPGATEKASGDHKISPSKVTK